MLPVGLLSYRHVLGYALLAKSLGLLRERLPKTKPVKHVQVVSGVHPHKKIVSKSQILASRAHGEM